MAVKNYRNLLIEYIRANALPPDKLSHQERLYRLARRLGRGEAYDDDVLFAAAWLHDLGVFIGHRPRNPAKLATWDHVAYACQRAPGILRRFGFPPGKIARVLEVIRTHLPSETPVSLEGVLLRDADILEQLGAVGVLRVVSKVGRDTRFVRFSDALKVLHKNARELPGKLRLESARRVARLRVKALKSF